MGRGGGPTPIFGAADGPRVQGTLTKVGGRAFEAARQRLARLSGREIGRVSDAATFDYLARMFADLAASPTWKLSEEQLLQRLNEQ